MRSVMCGILYMMKLYQRPEFIWVTVFTAGVVSAFVFLYEQSNLFLGVFVALLAFILVYARPVIALYGMALLYPFTTFKLYYGSLDVEYVDLVALLLFGVYCLQQGWKMITARYTFRPEEFPYWQWYAGFLLIAGLSVLNADAYHTGVSLKFVLRPLLFLYLMWIVLPLHYIKDKHTLRRMMGIMYGVGLVSAFVAFVQFFLYEPTEGFRRMLPPNFFGYHLMGQNHNLLAEFLVGVLPFGYYFFTQQKNVFYKNMMLLSLLFMAGVCFLTLSRSGWLGMAVAFAVIALVHYRKQIKQHAFKIMTMGVALFALPLAVVLYLINTSALVQGSNMNRLNLIEVALALFREHPFVGSGVGTFVYQVEQIHFYIIQYGGPLDAHSMFFKVLSEAGLFGVIFFFGFVAMILVRLIVTLKMTLREESVILLSVMLASVVGLLVFENFGTSYFLAKMWLPVGLALVAEKLIRRNITV